ncbi:ABC transporter substrate-binding protein [Prauserella flavalba]|uniref:ABC transporter substrate-binding protein n=1 Tax=Prauserella flavalba TaxID=1477506 RepID=UPI0036ECCE92
MVLALAGICRRSRAGLRGRVAALFAAMTLLVAACASPPQRGEGSAVVFQPSAESFAMLTQLNAFSGDFFARQGVDVTYNPVIPNAAQATQSVTGGADIAIVGSTGVVPTVAAARDVVTVAVIAKGPTTQITLRDDVIDRLGVSPDAPVRERIAALKGLSLALPTPGSATDVMVREALRSYGVQPDSDLTIRPVTEPSALVTAMREKQVDGFAFSAPTSVQPVAEGYGTVWLSVSDLPEYADMPWIDVVTSRQYLKDHRATVVKFVRALSEAASDLRANPDQAADRIRNKYYPDLSEQAFGKSFELALPSALKDPMPTQHGLDVLLEVVNASADSPSQVQFDELYDRTVVSDAGGGKS